MSVLTAFLMLKSAFIPYSPMLPNEFSLSASLRGGHC
jgi:hypothetical protein